MSAVVPDRLDATATTVPEREPLDLDIVPRDESPSMVGRIYIPFG